MKDAIKPYSMILSKQSDTAKNQFALNKNVNTYIYIYIYVYLQQFISINFLPREVQGADLR